MVFLSYVELYNNHLYDLLSKVESLEYSPVRIHEHAVRGIILTGSPTLRTPVSSAEEALSLIARGTLMRSTASTNLNERSSRSHTVITLEIVTQTRILPSESDDNEISEFNSKKTVSDGGLITKVGRINFVDLAGSERVKVSGATGQTFEEAKQINKALSVLGDVLNALSKKDSSGLASSRKESFIPYRNSKLTMLLKDSLGGNAKTMMIATIRPLSTFFAQTLVTLRYAARTKLIQCNPVRNLRSKDSTEAIILNSAMNEIHQLKVKLEQRNEEYQQLQMKVQELQNSKALDDLSPSPKDVQTANYNSRMEKEYLAKMEDIQARSYEDRLVLQEKMKSLISNHEASINKLQSDNVQLEQQLLLQIHKFDKVVEQKNKVESNNEELVRHLSSKLSELSRLHYDHTRLKQDLSSANEKITELSTLESDKKQFLEAIKKLNESRLKYKQRCDSQSEELSHSNRNNLEFQQIIEDNNSKLIQNSEEIECLKVKFSESEVSLKKEIEYLKMKYSESESLLKKAALKIKDLVTTKPPLRTDSRSESVHSDSIDKESTEKLNHQNLVNIASKVTQLKNDFIGEKHAIIDLKNTFLDDITKQQQLLMNTILRVFTSKEAGKSSLVSCISDETDNESHGGYTVANETTAVIDNGESETSAVDKENAESVGRLLSLQSLDLASITSGSGSDSPSSPVTIKKSLLKNIEKEMINNMENRLKELKSAKENFVKFSGILSESGCKGESASWISIESVLCDLQNQCKDKDSLLFDMQTEIDRLKRENRDYRAKVKSSESMVKLQDLQLKGLKTNLDKSRVQASTSIQQGIDLLRSYVLTKDTKNCIGSDDADLAATKT
jgi:hypothetical protein